MVNGCFDWGYNIGHEQIIAATEIKYVFICRTWVLNKSDVYVGKILSNVSQSNESKRF